VKAENWKLETGSLTTGSWKLEADNSKLEAEKRVCGK
jgi:hypothetical protein